MENYNMEYSNTIGKYLSVIHALKLIEILDNLSTEPSSYNKLETVKVISTNLSSISNRFAISKMDTDIKSILDNYLKYYDIIIKQKLIKQGINLDTLNSTEPVITGPTTLINQQSLNTDEPVTTFSIPTDYELNIDSISNYIENTVTYPQNVNSVINGNPSLNNTFCNDLSEDETISDHTEYDELTLHPGLVDEEPKVYINKYYDISDKVDSLEYVSKRGRKSKKINYKD